MVFRRVGLLINLPLDTSRGAIWSVFRCCQAAIKKADATENPVVFRRVGLLINLPLDTSRGAIWSVFRCCQDEPPCSNSSNRRMLLRSIEIATTLYLFPDFVAKLLNVFSWTSKPAQLSVTVHTRASASNSLGLPAVVARSMNRCANSELSITQFFSQSGKIRCGGPVVHTLFVVRSGGVRLWKSAVVTLVALGAAVVIVRSVKF